LDRREFLLGSITAGAGAVTPQLPARSSSPAVQAGEFELKPELISPGIWKFTIGNPEKITPVKARFYPPDEPGIARLQAVVSCAVSVTGSVTSRGCVVTIPLAADEAVFGMGLQMKSCMQRGSKKLLRVNADPKMDSGDAHAAPAFYVTTRGYGVLIDTARYTTFYSGSNELKNRPIADTAPNGAAAPPGGLPAAYKRVHFESSSQMQMEIPRAQGVDVYVFGGPSMREAVQRYNLFSGGGALPPRWGLGVWYRAKGDFNQEQVLALSKELREHRIPCDVLGLEPGWQSHSYSCSYVWSDAFPKPAAMIAELRRDNYHVNLWEHAFVHPTSPLHAPLAARSADYQVWEGLVPDFLDPKARDIFAEFHDKEHVDIGVEGYKLDECDNSDFTGGWSFPEISRFPSGIDGEQMHSLFGLSYQRTIQGVFEKRDTRTFGLARSSGALSAPYPYALYSDLYDHRDFIRALVNSGFSGLLWTPEVRDAANAEDLLRRLQSVIFSPVALINAWNVSAPPWQQAKLARSERDHSFADPSELEASCRSILELRMRFLPYLHAAFARYHAEGVPPFRALVLDFPDDRRTWFLEDQYLVGEGLLVAPMFAGEVARTVYLPRGTWFDFWTGERHQGEQIIDVSASVERIPLFVRDGTLLPLAQPTIHSQDEQGWSLEASVYGKSSAACILYEGDEALSAEPVPVELRWDAHSAAGSISVSGNPNSGHSRYKVTSWRVVGR
jgi:alpha-D-xyloside xylohydrolase